MRLTHIPVRTILNIVFFQLAWAVAVLWGNTYAAVITLFYLCVHQWLLVERRREWLLIALVVVVGVFVDTLLKIAGILIFSPGQFLIPVWLICIWVMFATTLCHSFRWLRTRFWLSAILAAIAGPLSYWGGARLSDVDIGQPQWISLLVLSVWWAIFFPVALWATFWVDHEN